MLGHRRQRRDLVSCGVYLGDGLSRALRQLRDCAGREAAMLGHAWDLHGAVRTQLQRALRSESVNDALRLPLHALVDSLRGLLACLRDRRKGTTVVLGQQ